jgi:hypothetical protein
MAEGKTSRVAQVAVAAGAGVVLAAGVAATQVASAESTAETLANISASLSNIEDAVGKHRDLPSFRPRPIPFRLVRPNN